MEFQNSVKKLSERIKSNLSKVSTEEATKTSFILPLLNCLGYDIFDPSVVIPEFTADIGKKKGEKVDYAIVVDDKPVILIEAKTHTEKLDRHKTQLERYFTVTDSKFGILTNGVEYQFYSDLKKPNVMDETPFLNINLLDLKDRDFKELEKFKAENFNIENILSMAGSKKYITGIKDIFKNEIKDPSDDFVKLFASRLTSKPIRQNVIEEFVIYSKQAFSEIINDLVSDKIDNFKNKISSEDTLVTDTAKDVNDDGIVTTQEEMEGYFIIKSILAETIELKRIAIRDTKSYLGILLDDNNRKWICRLLFNTKQKYIEVRVSDKESNKYPIEDLNDIFQHKDEIIKSVDIF